MTNLKFTGTLRVFVLTFIMGLLSSGIAMADVKPQFSDMKGYAWANEYVNYVYAQNGLKGYEDGSFRPGNNITRAEFVAVVVRIVKSDKAVEVKPDDKVLAELNEKASNYWANDTIATASTLGILENLAYPLEKTAWDQPINRGDMAKISINALEKIKKEDLKIDEKIKGSIPDIAELEKMKNNELILKAYSNGIIMGYDDGSFKANNFANRAEASTILARLINKDYRKTTIYKNQKAEIPKVYDYDLSEYVNLPPYKSDPFIYNDEQLNQIIKQRIAFFTEFKEVDRAVKDKDEVNIDFVGKKDGKAFEGGTGKNYKLVIGSNTFIDGFEKGLIGAKKGETRTLNLTFPKDYHSSELAGQAVTFDVTINKVFGETPAVFNDDYVKANIPGYTSAERYKEDLKVNVKIEAWFNKVLTVTTVSKYPKKEYDELVEANFGSTGIPADSKEKHDKQIKALMKREMVLFAIAKSEGVKIDEKTFAAKFPEYEEYYEKNLKGKPGMISAERYALFELMYKAVVKSALELNIAL